jgi:hypothetical protein
MLQVSEAVLEELRDRSDIDVVDGPHQLGSEGAFLSW